MGVGRNHQNRQKVVAPVGTARPWLPSAPCRMCGGTRYAARRAARFWVCATCHPAVDVPPGELIMGDVWPDGAWREGAAVPTAP